MNNTEWVTLDRQCNICESTVESSYGQTRCTNIGCITRDRDIPLSVDSTAQDVHEYYQSKDVVTVQRIDELCEQLADRYFKASSIIEAEKISQNIRELIHFSSYEVADLIEDNR